MLFLRFLVLISFLVLGSLAQARTTCYETKVETGKIENLYTFETERWCDVETAGALDWDEVLLANEKEIIYQSDIIHYARQTKNELWLSVTKSFEIPKGSLVVSSNYVMTVSEEFEIEEKSFKVVGTGDAKHVKYTGSFYKIEPYDNGYWFRYGLEVHLEKPFLVPRGVFENIVIKNIKEDTAKEAAEHLELIQSLL